AIAAALWFPRALDIFEYRTWDLRARLLARPGSATSQVVTIMLDDKSLAWGKDVNGLSWPWPRQLYGIVADFCRQGGAKALVFDVLYTEPSSYGVDDDNAFADALKQNGSVVGAMQLSALAPKGLSATWPADAAAPPVPVAGLEAWLARNHPSGMYFKSAELAIPGLLKSARYIANTNLPPDSADGVYRREPLFSVFDNRVVPSEALGAWLVGHAGGTLSIRPGQLRVGDIRVPIDSDGRAILRYRGPTLTHPNYSAAAILQSYQQISDGKTPTVDPSVFKDKYVLFGFTAPGLLDLKPTPMSRSLQYPGVEINATMLDNLLSRDFMHPMSTAATLALLLILCLGAGVAVSAVSGAGRTALIYVVFIPIAPALSIAAYAVGWWMQLFALELGTLFSLVGSSLVSNATEGQQKRYIKSAFKQYLSPTIIEELIAHPERLKLGGEKRDLSIFFSDLQGFTSISEVLTPEELTLLLNEYLSAMTDIIQEEGGTIDKYEGDAIIAFWNAPLSQPDHAVRAVRAALRCQEKLDEMRPVLRARVKKDLYKRIGINSGPAVVGNFGSHTKFNYTMLGDAVNLASRLEGVNKQFKTYTMISAMVKERLENAFPVRELSRIAVVGRKEPVTVYEPMTAAVHAQRRQMLEVFDAGLTLYYAGKFDDACGIFESIAGQDPAASCYVEKCKELSSAPPTDSWSGVWVMTQK
ncbi:MAG TPA: adenylate/guanylate cyclase domain-containing protein, partial [Spirochaetia bacterium]|nr:adenylate/guanylate cyclase domain-containing protein [Spirochaetia bacterium]